ncbi:ABC transporter permease [Aquimarina megaterium]|uniref:ABC transporter permease n=1 Tax=Aquimarina megaterium TaxID=1443666 RepID=UPI0009432B76|nr:ABC transporter permease [Aquimarina megaterium]
MFKNYIKIAWRNLKRNKGYSVVNIGGLTIGLSAVIFMLFYINHENSYDVFHTDYDRLFRIERTYVSSIQSDIWDSTPYILSDELKSSIPEITNATSIRTTANYLGVNDAMYHEKNGLFADNEFLKLFTLKFVEGDQNSSLENPMSIVLSESLAKKLSPESNIIGKTIHIDKKYDCVVTGVFADYPDNSHLKIDYLLSFSSYKTITRNTIDAGWGANNASTYVQLRNNAEIGKVSEKIKGFLTNHLKLEDGIQELLSLRPIRDIYMKTSKVRGGGGNRSEITTLYLFLAVVIFTALISLLNYINSSTAQVMKRELEIGIKKVMGSTKSHLRYQFITESLVMVSISFIIAIGLVLLFLPLFNKIVGKNLSIVFSQDWPFFIYAMLGSLLAGILAGLYPVFFLTSLKISSFLQGNSSIKRRAGLRKALVVFQLVLVIPLVFTSILIIEQFKYIEQRDIGFVKEDLLVSFIDVTNKEDREVLKTIGERLLQNPNILNYSISDSGPFGGGRQQSMDWEGNTTNEKAVIRSHRIDYDFLKTYQMKLIEGRDFSEDYATDIQSACIINQTALELFGWDNALGKKINNGRLKVIGVVKDFNDYTAFKKIPPMILFMDQGSGSSYVTIKVASNKRAEAQTLVNTLFNNDFPENPIEFSFLDDNLDSSYLNSLKGTINIFIFFSVLAILLAVLGLYSLVSFSLKTQQKMIAIRKVLGANAKSIFLILLREYMILFCIAATLGLITVYFIANKIIHVFAYHEGVKFIYLIMAGLLALFVVLFSVSSKIVSAVLQNPIKSLRKE